MVWTIVRKELIYHITTARVLIFFIISTSLFIINGITLVGSHKSSLEIYNTWQAGNWASRNTIGTSVIKKPNPLELCVEDNSHIRPQMLSINLDGTVQSSRRSQYENFKLPKVRRIDWSFIIQTVYALFCVVLTFDAISGERVTGTLRLMMSNSLSRAQVLLGKYLAVLIITFITLLTGGLLSLAIVNLLSVRIPTKADFVPLMLFILLSMLYISLFISMSLLASSLVRTSATALLSLLFIVILLVFIVPNMTGIISGKLVNALSDYESRARSDAIGEEYIKSSNDLHKRIQSGELKDKDEIIKTDRGNYLRMAETRKKVIREYENGLMKRQTMAETLALISPSAFFQASGESLANTGSIFQKRFQKAAERYKEIYLDYVKSKVGEIIQTIQPPVNIRLPDGTIISVPEVRPKSYEGDKSDFPLFEYPDPPIQERLRDGLFGIALLMLWSVICFLGAHVIFIKRSI